MLRTNAEREREIESLIHFVANGANGVFNDSGLYISDQKNTRDIVVVFSLLLCAIRNNSNTYFIARAEKGFSEAIKCLLRQFLRCQEDYLMLFQCLDHFIQTILS